MTQNPADATINPTEAALEVMRVLNYRDLSGLCRCLWFDNNSKCQFTPCHFYHRGKDCIEFTATGTCSRDPECSLQHDQLKHDYCKRMPLRSDISRAVRAVWVEATKMHSPPSERTEEQELTTIVFEPADDEECGWLETIIAADRKMCMTAEQLLAIRSLVQRRVVVVLQQLERLFRMRRMDTWLIARRFRGDEKMQLAAGTVHFFQCCFVRNGNHDNQANQTNDSGDIEDMRNGDVSAINRANPAPYHLFISVRYAHSAIEELLMESNSYAENFERLLETGFLCTVQK